MSEIINIESAKTIKKIDANGFSLDTGTIYSFKLSSGEEMIAKVVSDVSPTSDNIVISNPLSIAPSQNGLGFMPTIFTAKIQSARTVLNMAVVTMVADVADDFKNAYIEATTGITLPPKKILMS